jgi:hypothetical protein
MIHYEWRELVVSYLVGEVFASALSSLVVNHVLWNATPAVFTSDDG